MSGRRSWAAPGVPLVRPAASKELITKAYVFCEGENTEPSWLDYLQAKAKMNGLWLHLCPSKGCGVPMSVVDFSVEKRERLLHGVNAPADDNGGSKDRSNVEANDEVWVVIDRDQHDLTSALQKARDNGVGIVFTNPCFELWPLLHLQEQHSLIDRWILQSDLKRLHPEYSHSKGAAVDWRKLEGGQEDAVRRARNLHRENEAPGSPWSAAGSSGERLTPPGPGKPFGNPTTTAWIFHLRCTDPSFSDSTKYHKLRPHPRRDDEEDLWQALAEPLRAKVADSPARPEIARRTGRSR